MGKKTNLKNEVIGHRHRVSAQAMAKKGKALKKPRGRSAGGRRGREKQPIVDKQPQQWPLQQGRPRRRRATNAVGGRDDAPKASRMADGGRLGRWGLGMTGRRPKATGCSSGQQLTVAVATGLRKRPVDPGGRLPMAATVQVAGPADDGLATVVASGRSVAAMRKRLNVRKVRFLGFHLVFALIGAGIGATLI